MDKQQASILVASGSFRGARPKQKIHPVMIFTIGFLCGLFTGIFTWLI